MKWNKVGEKTPKVDTEFSTSDNILLLCEGLLCPYIVGFYSEKKGKYCIAYGKEVEATHWAYIHPPKRKEQC